MEGAIYRLEWVSGEIRGEGFVWCKDINEAEKHYDAVHTAMRRPMPYTVTKVEYDKEGNYE